jgi:hypothetical protein
LALRKTSSYLIVLHSRSTKTLSRQQSLLSMLMLIPYLQPAWEPRLVSFGVEDLGCAIACPQLPGPHPGKTARLSRWRLAMTIPCVSASRLRPPDRRSPGQCGYMYCQLPKSDWAILPSSILTGTDCSDALDAFCWLGLRYSTSIPINRISCTHGDVLP